jgi:hypothetical protein
MPEENLVSDLIAFEKFKKPETAEEAIRIVRSFPLADDVVRRCVADRLIEEIERLRPKSLHEQIVEDEVEEMAQSCCAVFFENGRLRHSKHCPNRTTASEPRTHEQPGVPHMRLDDYYGDGSGIPQLHPDPAINSAELITALCTKLDTAREALTRVLDMNVVTPAAQSMKQHVRWALNETHPTALSEQHRNCG